jgi:hypothetical protein
MPNEVLEKPSAGYRSSIFLSIFGLGLLYFLTAPRVVTFEDAGLFLSTSFDWGLPHPPGYPLYTLISHLMMKLLGPSPLAGASVSIVSSLLALFFLAQILKSLDCDRKIIFVVLALLGTSKVYWNQSIVPEVYAVFIALFLWSVERLLASKDRPSWTLFVAVGLSFANHWPLFLLASPILVVIAVSKPWFRSQWKRTLVGVGLSALIAVFFYCLMMWRSQNGATLAFLGEIKTPAELWQYFLRSYYSTIEESSKFRVGEYFKLLADHFGSMALSGSLSLTLLSFLGVLELIRTRRYALLAVLLYGLLHTPILLPLLIRLEFNELNRNVLAMFHLVAWCSAAVLASFSLSRSLKVAGGKGLGNKATLVVAVGVLLTNDGLNNLGGNNFRADQLADGYARLVLDSLPPNATLFAATDADLGPIMFVREVLGVRPDVKLKSQTGVIFPDPMFAPYDFSQKSRSAKTLHFLVNHSPVFSTKRFDVLEKEKNLPLTFNYNGMYYAVDERLTVEAPKTPAMVQMALKLVDAELENQKLWNWPYHRGVIMARLCNLLVLNGHEDHGVFSTYDPCRVIYAKHLRAKKSFQVSSEVIRSVLDRQKDLMIASDRLDLFHVVLLNELDRVNLDFSDGTLKIQHVVESAEYVTLGLELYQKCDNPVWKTLQSIRPVPSWGPKALKAFTNFAHCQKT